MKSTDFPTFLWKSNGYNFDPDYMYHGPFEGEFLERVSRISYVQTTNMKFEHTRSFDTSSQGRQQHWAGVPGDPAQMITICRASTRQMLHKLRMQQFR
jgi:hypothetical protein